MASPPPARVRGSLPIAFVLLLCVACTCVGADGVSTYEKEIEPFLADHCFDCHADGAAEGGRAFDASPRGAMLKDRAFWWAVLKNVRAGLMPPPDYGSVDKAQREKIAGWITREVFGVDPNAPDPGRAIVRRLNRAEYENTIRDLMGVKINATLLLPADDSGGGFDNVADALMLSPLLVEKYLEIGQSVVGQAFKKNKGRFLNRDEAPDSKADRRAYARQTLKAFTRKAFRRPADKATLDRLVDLAEQEYQRQERSFEQGVAHAMSAVLASPRFLFRLDTPAPNSHDSPHPRVDEYSLASRLSYLLWSSMPDEELLRLAAEGKLRGSLAEQVDRMLEDRKAVAFARNFAGQWLRSRDVEHVSIDPIAAAGRMKEYVGLRRRARRLQGNPDKKDEFRRLNAKADKIKGLRTLLDNHLRRAMQRETEMHFDHIVQQDRSLLELIDCDYTFLNDKLAKHYGVPGVSGGRMRKVDLPEGSPRGGVLTQGATLMVTSNPSRTSPVKRGLFILDNLLGTPPPPPPADVPELEDAAAALADKNPTLRELLAAHRENPACATCHNRMDPLGLALENFDATGHWRDAENDHPIDASGTLASGEAFTDVRALKKIIATTRREDFFRCATQKLLTYAIGRQFDYYDEPTADLIVDQLDASDGRFRVLLSGVIQSAPFQRMRAADYESQISSNAQATNPESNDE